MIARGNHQEPTFRDPADYGAYLNRLARYQRQHGIILYAYCLMPNHVHLLIRTSEVPLGKFMQSVQQSYTQRFNRVYATVGHVFHGRYKAIVCEREEHLVALLRYIHLNPVRAGLAERPEAYPYSGHAAYLHGEPSALIDPTPLLRLLGGPRAYRRLLADDALPTRGQSDGKDGGGPATGTACPPRDLLPIPLGNVQPLAPLWLAIETLARQVGMAPEVLRGTDRSWAVSRARTAALYVLVRRLGYRPSEVAPAFGRAIASVSALISRFAERPESPALVAALVSGAQTALRPENVKIAKPDPDA